MRIETQLPTGHRLGTSAPPKMTLFPKCNGRCYYMYTKKLHLNVCYFVVVAGCCAVKSLKPLAPFFVSLFVHRLQSLCLCVFLCLPLCLVVCPSVCTSVCPSRSPSVCVCKCVAVCLCACPSLCVCVCLCVCHLVWPARQVCA